jgi:hypothetical protein
LDLGGGAVRLPGWYNLPISKMVTAYLFFENANYHLPALTAGSLPFFWIFPSWFVGGVAFMSCEEKMTN